MTLLLDSHVVLYWLGRRLDRSPRLLADLRDPTIRVVVSVASIWELEIKAAKGRLDLPADLAAALRDDFDLLAISSEHATAAARLPPHHADPFDRMLVAQAQLESATLVTSDAAVQGYDVATRDPREG